MPARVHVSARLGTIGDVKVTIGITRGLDRMILRIISVVLLCALVVSGASADSGVNYCVTPNAQAATAEANACIAPDAITAAQTACASIKAGQVCLGAGDVQTTPANGLAVVGTA